MCSEVLLRASSADSSPDHHWMNDTVRLYWPCRSAEDVGAGCSLTLGLPTLDRFPQFSAIDRKRPSIGIQVKPKTAEIDQSWPYSPLPSQRSRTPPSGPCGLTVVRGIPCTICNRRQSTRGHLTFVTSETVRRATTDVWLVGVAQPSRVFNPRSRVSALLIAARGRGSTRVMLIDADNHRNATA